MFLLRLIWAVVHALFAKRVWWTSGFLGSRLSPRTAPAPMDAEEADERRRRIVAEAGVSGASRTVQPDR